MVKPTKIVALALVAVLVMGLVAGVAYWSVGYDPSKVDPGLYLDGRKVDDVGTVITVDGHEVGFDLYRYVYLTNKYTIAMYYGGDEVFEHDPDGSLGDYLREAAEESVRQWYAWIDLGEQIGVTADDALLAEVEAEIAEDKELYGAQFEAHMADIFLANEDTYREVLTIQKLVAKVQEEYEAHLEAENGEELLAGVATARHILITADGFAEHEEEYEALMANATVIDLDEPEDDEPEDELADGDEADEAEDESDVLGLTDDADAPEEVTGGELNDALDADDVEDEDALADAADDNDALADDVLAQDENYYSQRAKAFADWIVERIYESSDPVAAFDEYRLMYDEDPGQAAEGYTAYTFAEGTMVTEFYEGALALDINEVGKPVETSYGYHILLRLPLDEEAVETDGLVAGAVSSMLNELYYELYDAQEVTYGVRYADMEPANIK